MPLVGAEKLLRNKAKAVTGAACDATTLISMDLGAPCMDPCLSSGLQPRPMKKRPFPPRNKPAQRNLA